MASPYGRQPYTSLPPPTTPNSYLSPGRSYLQNQNSPPFRTPQQPFSPRPQPRSPFSSPGPNYYQQPQQPQQFTYEPSPSSTVENRIIFGKIFSYLTAVIVPLCFFTGFQLIIALAISVTIFWYLWNNDKGDYAVLLAVTLWAFTFFYGTWPVWSTLGSSVVVTYSRPFEGAKPTEIQEEIELEIQTPYEFFNATEFIEDLSLTLNVSRDNIKITKRYASSEQSYVSVTILIIYRVGARERRLLTFTDELKSRMRSEYLKKYKIVRVDRALSREEERLIIERSRRPTPPSPSHNYDDDILGGDASVEVLVGPRITIGGGGHICPDDKANITFTMDGTGPWTIVYNRGPPTYETFQFVAEYSPYTIQTDKPGLYQLGRGTPTEWVTPFHIFERKTKETVPHDHYCPAIEMSGQAHVYTHTKPDASFVKSSSYVPRQPFDQTVCQGEKQKLSVELTGTPPFSLTYSVLYGERAPEELFKMRRAGRSDNDGTFVAVETIDNIMKSPYVIEAEQSGEYKILNVTDRYCSNSKFTEEERHLMFVWVRGLPKARVVGGKCKGEDIIVTLTSGTMPWSLTYRQDNSIRTIRDIRESNVRIPTDTETDSEFTFEYISDRSCNGSLVNGPITIKPLPQPVARMSGGGPVLEGKTVDIVIEFTGSPPWSFTYALDDGNSITETIITDVASNPYKFAVSKKGRYYLTSLSDAHCGKGLHTGSATVSLYQLPTGYLKASRENFCRGQEAPTLQFHLRGAHPWTIEYSLSTSYGDDLKFKETNIKDSPFIAKADGAGTYTFHSITDNYGNSVKLKYANTATIKVSELPTAEWMEDTSECKSMCDGEKVDLRVRFTGSPPWSISYTDGDNTFTETGIEQSPHVIQVSRPGKYRLSRVEDRYCSNWNNAKDSVCVTTKTSATCVIQLDHKFNGEYHICSNQELRVKCSGTGPFKIVYFNGVRYTTKASFEPEFTIPVTGTGRYTFSEITDASECKGRLLSQGPTGQTERASVVVVDDLPTVTMTTRQSSYSICEGETVDLLFSFTGHPPYTLLYTHTKPGQSPQQQRITNIESTPFTLRATEEGTYSVRGVGDYYCGEGNIEQSQPITITHHTAPSAYFVRRETATSTKVCEGESLSIAFTGTSPWSFSYRITEPTQGVDETRTETNIQYSPFTIQAKIPGTYSIIKLTDSRCSTSRKADSITVYPMPRASISGGGTVCEGDRTNITVHLTGTKPWTIKYMNDADHIERIETNIQSSPHNIITGKAGNYYLTAISDSNCHYERKK